MMPRVEDRFGPTSTPTAIEDHRHTVRPRAHPGVAAQVERPALSAGGDVADLTNATRLLANRLIVGLDDQPFRPTADQLAWVWGGDLVQGETRASRARIAAGRYAALLADHVIGDVTVEGAPGAYARIWLCARSAFIGSTGSRPSEPPSDGGLAASRTVGALVAAHDGWVERPSWGLPGPAVRPGSSEAATR